MSTLPFTLPSHPHRRRNNRTLNMCDNPTVSSRDVNLEFAMDTVSEKHLIKETMNGIKYKDVVNGTVKYKEPDNSVPLQRILKSRKTCDSSSNLLVQPSFPERHPLIMNGNGTPSTDSNSNDSSIPTNYRKLETSASVPYNLSEAANGVTSIKHSSSTASMPAVIKVKPLPSTAANSSESMPNLMATPPTTLVEPVPVHRSPLMSSSLSESDITSEQSGWVSSRRSSVDTSSGQISPTGKFRFVYKAQIMFLILS